MDIAQCPGCGSPRIKKVTGRLRRVCEGQSYIVQDVTYHRRADCGDQVYGPEAVRRIQAESPAYQVVNSVK